MKNNNIPSELKPFAEKFFASTQQYNDSRLFDDFLQYIIHGWSFDYTWNPSQHYEETGRVFGELYEELIRLLNKQIRVDGEWYDPFGSLYECCISSHSRRADAGQFFTPSDVVNLMVRINVGKDPKSLIGRGVSMADIACGSGRILIAFHAIAPGNFEFGQDSDRTCCLMSVCNMLLHGAVGEIVWGNSLDPHSYREGWLINSDLHLTGVPRVRTLAKEHSALYNRNQQCKQSDTIPSVLITNPAHPEQLTLFG